MHAIFNKIHSVLSYFGSFTSISLVMRSTDNKSLELSSPNHMPEEDKN